VEGAPHDLWFSTEGGEGQTLHSFAGLPIEARDEVLGMMGLFCRFPRRLHPREIELLAAMGHQIGVAIKNTQLFRQVQAGHERLRWLTQQVVSAQEDERRRVSRELHDEAGQALTALAISLDLIRSDLPAESGSLHQRLGEAVALTDTTMEHIRLLAQDLRPPALDTIGLDCTLEGLCQDFARRTRLSVEYAGTEIPALTEAAAISLYRFLQEALTNVARHANANWISVVLRRDAETISLTVEDDGEGFQQGAAEAMGIGLLGMQERLELLGGRLQTQSWPGQGTRLTAHIPVHAAHMEKEGRQ